MFREAFRRAVRTFSQSFGGAVAAMQFVPDTSVLVDLGCAAGGAGLAALAAFWMNVGEVEA